MFTKCIIPFARLDDAQVEFMTNLEFWCVTGFDDPLQLLSKRIPWQGLRQAVFNG